MVIHVYVYHGVSIKLKDKGVLCHMFRSNIFKYSS